MTFLFSIIISYELNNKCHSTLLVIQSEAKVLEYIHSKTTTWVLPRSFTPLRSVLDDRKEWLWMTKEEIILPSE